jgi:hypothetical protein
MMTRLERAIAALYRARKLLADDAASPAVLDYIDALIAVLMTE